jgi:hypothetical protein
LNSKQTFDASNNPADRTADYCADRACGLIAHGGAMSNSAGNTLRVGCKREGEGSNNRGCEQHFCLHV